MSAVHQRRRRRYQHASAHWSEVYAVVTDREKIKLGFQKKSKVPSLRCKKVCQK